jgi:hypothetical protein
MSRPNSTDYIGIFSVRILVPADHVEFYGTLQTCVVGLRSYDDTVLCLVTEEQSGVVFPPIGRQD